MKRRIGAIFVPLLIVAFAAACGGKRPVDRPPRTPSPVVFEEGIQSRVQIGGFALIPRDEWTREQKSPCASLNDEAPFYGAGVYGVSDAALPDLGVAASFTPRMCNMAGITALGTTVGLLRLTLVAGPREWPLEFDAQQVLGSSVQGHEAVLIRSSRGGAVLLVSTPFGFVVIATRRPGSTEQDVISLASSLRYDAFFVPHADESFRGSLNGIRFYNQQLGERRAGCEVTQYGNEGGPVSIEAAAAVGIDVDLARLPPGTSSRPPEAYSCGGPADLYFVDLGRQSNPGTFTVRVYRATGETAWRNVLSRAWLRETTIGGRAAVETRPPPGINADACQIYLREDFGITVVQGSDCELVAQVAQSLY